MSPRILDCTEVRSALPLYSGGDLHPDREAALDRHLAKCADCRAHAARANSAREALLGGFARERRGGVDLWPSLRTSLVDEGVLRPSTPPVRRVEPRRRWLSIGTAAAAALLAGLWIQRSMSSGGAAPGTDPVRPIVEIAAQDAAVIDSAAPRLPVVAATPVKESHGLRRVQPGEPRLGDSADVFGREPVLLSPWSSNTGSPVSLQRVRNDIR